MKIALQHAQEKKARRITDLYLVLGQWSSIVDDSVQFYWDIISEGTIAQGAILHFERIPAELTCLDCGHVFPPREADWNCPACSGSHVQLHRGNEMRLEAVEIET